MVTSQPPPSKPQSILQRIAAIAIGKVQQHWLVILALGMRGSAVFAAFAVTYMIGRSYGAAATGQYALITQTAMLLSIIGLFGLDISVVRHFAKSMAEKRKVALRSMAQVLAIGLGMMSLMIAVLWFGSKPVWQLLFGDIVPQSFLLALAMLSLGRGAAQLLGGMLQSQHRFTLGQAVTAFSIPGATAIALATGLATSIEGALWAGILGALAGTILALIALSRHVSTKDDALTITAATVLASSIPLWGSGLAQAFGGWYGLAIAGQMLGAAEAGFFRIAVQIASVLLIVTSALQSVYSAKVSAAFHAGNRKEAALLARSAVRLSTALSFPIAGGILLGGEFLLAQIGPEFTEAATVMTIMVLGQFVITLTGSAGLVLAMSGNERLNLAISITGTTAMVIAAPLAAFYGGLELLAIAVATVLASRNIAAYIFVRAKTGINIWTGTVAEQTD